jgi:hypothetical protein
LNGLRPGCHGNPAGGFGVDQLNGIPQHLVVGLKVDVVDVDVADLSSFIDYEQGAFGPAVSPQHAVFLGEGAVGPEIAQEGIIDPAQAVCPGF